MPLFARSFRDLMTDSVGDLSARTSVTKLTAGGIARGLLEAVNTRLGEAYQIFDVNLARAFVSSASGQYLDMIGELLGTTRQPSEAARADSQTEIVKFYVAPQTTFGTINNGMDIVVPQGTYLATGPYNGGVRYRTTAQVTLPANLSSGWVSAEAMVPGEISNLGTDSLIYHSFVDYTDYANSTLLVTNVHPIANGKNIESDANYRYRITNRALEAEAANQTAIRLAVLSTPGIADVVLVPRYRGLSTFAAILKAVTPTVSDGLIDAVQSNLMRVIAFGDIAYVRRPKETGVSMKLSVYYSAQLSDDELTNIETTMTDLIKTYVNSLDIGETFLVNRMVSNLFSVSDKIANFGEAGKLVDELYVHVESRLQDNKVRQILLGDYVPAIDERIIIEPTLEYPITFSRKFTTRR